MERSQTALADSTLAAGSVRIPEACFLENRGQNTPIVKYYSMGNPALAFRDDGVMFLVRQTSDKVNRGELELASGLDHSTSNAIDHSHVKSLAYMMRFDGANQVAPVGMGRLPFESNFFYGNDPSRWRTDVPCFGEVIYRNIYDGVDMVFRLVKSGAKYDFVVAPWANSGVIAIRYYGIDSLSLNQGFLGIQTRIGEMQDSSPHTYQQDGREIPCGFTVRDSLSYGFDCKGRQAGAGIVIDPLIYSTFIGGSSEETIHSIKVDALGYVYVTGHTDSVDFPATPEAYDTSLDVGLSEFDSFVAKLDPTGSFLVYATYFGGTGEDRAESIALSPSGETYIAGYTSSNDFPTTPGSFEQQRRGSWDGFAAKLSKGGDNLLYSTYIGGGDEDKAWSVAVDGGGDAYVAGYTLSSDFPTTLGAFDTAIKGQDAFVIKLNSTASGAIYSTLLGGSNLDRGSSVTVDSSGSAYVAGWTYSADFPVSAAGLDTSYNGGRDAFITKLAPDGGSIVYSTFLGGSSDDQASSIAIDGSGFVHLAGQTESPDFPVTPGAFDTTFNGGFWDVFVAKVNPAGTNLIFSTFIGGSLTDGGLSVSVASSGNVYVSGLTSSTNFPTTAGALSTTLSGIENGILSEIDMSGSTLLYSTYIGGESYVWAGAVATDDLEDAYAAGMTTSSDFVTTPGALDRSIGGGNDGFVIKLRTSNPPDFIDLVINASDIRFSPGSIIINGTTAKINATVHNVGGKNATDVAVRFYDGAPAPPNQIGVDQIIPSVPYLFGIGFASVDWIPRVGGSHDICVVVDSDNVIAESNESNNQACVSVEVSVPPPDLSIAPSDVDLAPYSPITDNAVALVNATVHNLGGAASGATVVRYHDGVPPSFQIGADQPLPPIPVNGSANVSVMWTASPPGSHEICVVADPDNIVVEIDETNNMACMPVQVLSLPDLVPHDLNVTPSSPIPERTMSQINVTVSNEGDTLGGAFDVLLFDDKNGNGNPDAGEQIGVNASSGITGHSQSGFAVDWHATPAGTHSICAYADPPPDVVTESNETNNVACIDVLVQPGPILRPDYVPVSPLPLPPIRVGMSSQISLSVQVLNQGNGTATDNAIVAFHEQSSPPFSTFVLSPIAPAATSSRFTAIWTSPAIPGTYSVSVDVDYDNNVSEWDETNNVYTWTIEVVSGPVTSLVIGSPNYTSPAMTTYVESTTPLDLSVLDQSGLGIRNSTYRIDGGAPVNYTATGTFFLTTEGVHSIDWRSLDWAGNLEDVSSKVLTVDDTPPATAISIGEPKYLTGDNFVKSSTPLTLSTVDGGVGSNSTFYRLWGGSWSQWRDYSTSFNLAGRDGTWYVEFLSFDYLGNAETIKNETLVLDDNPPTTTMVPATGPYTIDTVFNLTAMDSGCGVNVTKYRIDGGSWAVYSGGFTLAEGEHNISYYSNDMLNNTEAERWLVVTVEGTTTPPEVAVNYKPVIALIFAIILLVAGVWSSKRRPWKGGKDRMAVTKALIFTSMPFVAAEAATGVISFHTGELSIPPVVGVGMAVDCTVLILGLVVLVARAMKKKTGTEEAPAR